MSHETRGAKETGPERGAGGAAVLAVMWLRLTLRHPGRRSRGLQSSEEVPLRALHTGPLQGPPGPGTPLRCRKWDKGRFLLKRNEGQGHCQCNWSRRTEVSLRNRLIRQSRNREESSPHSNRGRVFATLIGSVIETELQEFKKAQENRRFNFITSFKIWEQFCFFFSIFSFQPRVHTLQHNYTNYYRERQCNKQVKSANPSHTHSRQAREGPGHRARHRS